MQWPPSSGGEVELELELSQRRWRSRTRDGAKDGVYFVRLGRDGDDAHRALAPRASHDVDGEDTSQQPCPRGLAARARTEQLHVRSGRAVTRREDWLAETRRFRIAELSAGVAEGRLEQMRRTAEPGGGYRGPAPVQSVLRPGAVEQLHLSAEKLGGRHRRKARRFGLMLLFAWLPTAVLAIGLSSTFWARAVVGESDEAVLTGRRSYVTTDYKNNDKTHYVVDYEFGHVVGSEELDYDDWRAANIGDHALMLDVPSWQEARALRSEASLNWIAGAAGVPLLIIAIWALIRARKRDWYDQRRLEEKDFGRLPNPTASVERIYSLEG